jgi:hypothetical protein
MFCRFIADNLAQLDYKTQEEVLIVITQLNQMLSTSGMHLMDTLTHAVVDGGPGAIIAKLRLAVHRSVVDSDQVRGHSPGAGFQTSADLMSLYFTDGL